jgi:hypothetical protein
MSVGNAWKHRPERQARLIADMANPEWVRRKEMYRKARGRLAKMRVARWNVAWNTAGRPDNFPDFKDWSAANPLDGYEQIVADAARRVS